MPTNRAHIGPFFVLENIFVSDVDFVRASQAPPFSYFR